MQKKVSYQVKIILFWDIWEKDWNLMRNLWFISIDVFVGTNGTNFKMVNVTDLANEKAIKPEVEKKIQDAQLILNFS